MATADAEIEDTPVEVCEAPEQKGKPEKVMPTIPRELLEKFVGAVPNLHKIDARCVSDNDGNDKFRINVWTKQIDQTCVVPKFDIAASYYVSYNSKSKAKVKKINDETIINPILTQGAELATTSISIDGGKQTRAPGVTKQAASAS